MKQFTALYPLSKTLKFSLIPQGETLENINKKGLISEDEQRAKDYQTLKKIIDGYHRNFIQEVFQNFKFQNPEDLETFETLFFKPKKTEDETKDLEKLQTKLRKEIANQYEKSTDEKTKTKYQNLLKKELVREDLAGFLTDEEHKKIVADFRNFTTYLVGFNQNRSNVYSTDDISTAIPFRTIHINLPKFLQNKKVLENIEENYPELFETLKKAMPSLMEHSIWNGNINLEDLFAMPFYSHFVTQKGIELYNHLLGGATTETGEKLQGINEHINLYRQAHNLRKKEIPNLEPLYKQILSLVEKTSWLPKQFLNDNEPLEAIENFYQKELLHWQHGDNTINVFVHFWELFNQLENLDTKEIYLSNDTYLTSISTQIFEDWSIIGKALEDFYEKKNPDWEKSTKGKTAKEKLLKRWFYSIAEVDEALVAYQEKLTEEQKKKLSANCIETYFKDWSFFNRNLGKRNLLDNVQTTYAQVEAILNTPYDQDKKLAQDKEKVAKIKAFLDAILDVLHFVKPLNAARLEEGKDGTTIDKNFYDEYKLLYNQLKEFHKLYDKVRNYLTQKPYSTEKFKLNFQNGYLLGGWAQNYDSKAGLIFVHDNNYYLAINEQKLNTAERAALLDNPKNKAQRIILDVQKPDNKNTPRMFIRSKGTSYAPAVKEYNLPIETVIDIYDTKKFSTAHKKIDEAEQRIALAKLIDYFKLGFTKHSSYKHYNFKWRATAEYNSIDEFYNDTMNSTYQIKTETVDWDVAMDMANKGRWYLFQIYNKDFSLYAKGTPNLHTIYWKALFEPENVQKLVYKLSGGAEIFFRPKSIKNDLIEHPKNVKIAKKTFRTSDGLMIRIPDETVQKLNQYYQGKRSKDALGEEALKYIDNCSVFENAIIKDRRYTQNSFQFHVPISINSNAEKLNNINLKVNQYLQQADDLHIIGIDRGERHLLYLSIINTKGELIAQYSLNDIVNEHDGNKYITDYHALLHNKQVANAQARLGWGTIETIKELKEGYISQVVHKIAQLMVDKKAILVMEDLNFGFKKGRFGVEKQVYQKFEQKLIEKLNYLIFKTKPAAELGSRYNALQLTNPLISFEKLGKQSGFIFYVSPWNTSKIDPSTGFVNQLYSSYANAAQAVAFFKLFKSIRYNPAQAYFEFSFDYKNFPKTTPAEKTAWTVCTINQSRWVWDRTANKNKGAYKEIKVTEALEELFGNAKISYGGGENLIEYVVQQDAAFIKSLTYLLNLTLNLRQSFKDGNHEIDKILSPVKNKEGYFFDSQKALEKGKDADGNWIAKLPVNSDANGAFNIARKGLLLVERIKAAEDLKKLDIKITYEQWLDFAQKNPTLG